MSPKIKLKKRQAQILRISPAAAANISKELGKSRGPGIHIRLISFRNPAKVKPLPAGERGKVSRNNIFFLFLLLFLIFL